MADLNLKSAHSDPIERPSSSALTRDFVRQQNEKQDQGNFHSSSLKKSQVTMVSGSTVNKTNLHPGGVQ